MKNYFLASFIIAAAICLGSCGDEKTNTEFSVTSSPLPLIPSKAVSCYSTKITGIGQTPTQDVDADYFRIPTFKFWRKDANADLIISNIRITYTIPSTPGQAGETLKCEISGDNLRALKSEWWTGSTEATIPANQGTVDSPFQTDCAAYCGGVKTNMGNFTSAGTVEIFGLERLANGDETPVKLQGFITIQAF